MADRQLDDSGVPIETCNIPWPMGPPRPRRGTIPSSYSSPVARVSEPESSSASPSPRPNLLSLPLVAAGLPSSDLHISSSSSSPIQAPSHLTHEGTPPSSALSSSLIPIQRFSSASPRLLGSHSRKRHTSVSSESPLVGDFNLTSRDRCIITKTHVIYPPITPVICFPSVVIGFRVEFHQLTPGTLRDAIFSIKFLPSERKPSERAPIIKALYPSVEALSDLSSVDKSNPDNNSNPTSVTRKRETSVGISLGFDPFGSLHLDHNVSKEYTNTTRRKVQTSGVETSRALITLHEDPTIHDGIQSYLRFAVFLELPFTSTSKSFDAELSITANMAGDNVSSGIRRLLGSPVVVRMDFDGHTQLGTMKLGETMSNFGEISLPPQHPRQLITHPTEFVSRDLHDDGQAIEEDQDDDDADHSDYDNQPLFPQLPPESVTSLPRPQSE